jgi:predicted Zn-ribbon and HTH transcriptional regulator
MHSPENIIFFRLGIFERTNDKIEIKGYISALYRTVNAIKRNRACKNITRVEGERIDQIKQANQQKLMAKKNPSLLTRFPRCKKSGFTVTNINNTIFKIGRGL